LTTNGNNLASDRRAQTVRIRNETKKKWWTDRTRNCL